MVRFFLLSYVVYWKSSTPCVLLLMSAFTDRFGEKFVVPSEMTPPVTAGRSSPEKCISTEPSWMLPEPRSVFAVAVQLTSRDT